MKFGKESSALLGEMLEKQRKIAGMSYAELGKAADVHSSQASRICRGQFKTLSGNVLQICRALKVAPASAKKLGARQVRVGAKEKLARAAAQSVLALWDQTPEGANRVVRLLDDIVALARSEHKVETGIGPQRRAQ